MPITPAEIENLKKSDRFAPEIDAQKGRVADLERENLIVHIGKPIGSVTGWLGTYFWQVWTEHRDAAGIVHARIDQDAAVVWTLDDTLSTVELLDQAKDRLIDEVRARRETDLGVAKERLAQLRAAN